MWCRCWFTFVYSVNRQLDNSRTERNAGCCFSVDETRTERSAWPRVVFSLSALHVIPSSVTTTLRTSTTQLSDTWEREYAPNTLLDSRVYRLSSRLSRTARTLDLVFSCLHGIVCHVRPASLSLSPSFFLSVPLFSLSPFSRRPPSSCCV